MVLLARVAEARDDPRQRAAAAFRAGGSRDGREASAGRRSPRRRSRPACPTPAHPVWDTLEVQLRSASRRRCMARRPRSRRSTNWRPTGSAACGARASADDPASAICCRQRPRRGVAEVRAGADASRTSWCSSATTGRGTGAWSRKWRPRSRRQTGIKVDFTLLPIDALSARLKAELNSGSSGIDIIQWTAPYAGWLAPHHGGSREAAGEHRRQASRLRLGRLPAVDPRHGELPGQAARHSVSRDGEHPELPEAVAGRCRVRQGAGATGPSSRRRASPPPRPARRTATGSGIWGRQGPAMVGGFSPFLRGNGGDYFDPKTWEIQINNATGGRGAASTTAT